MYDGPALHCAKRPAERPARRAICKPTSRMSCSKFGSQLITTLFQRWATNFFGFEATCSCKLSSMFTVPTHCKLCTGGSLRATRETVRPGCGCEATWGGDAWGGDGLPVGTRTTNTRFHAPVPLHSVHLHTPNSPLSLCRSLPWRQDLSTT